mgnify:CR=1 FL=1
MVEPCFLLSLAVGKHMLESPTKRGNQVIIKLNEPYAPFLTEALARQLSQACVLQLEAAMDRFHVRTSKRHDQDHDEEAEG